MNFTQYQKEIQRTLSNNTFRDSLANMVIGLNEESGEVASPIKKHLYQGHDLNKDEVADELGDVLWYAFNLATLLDINMSDVAVRNIQKLMKRYPNGFREQDSINRK